MLRYLKYLSFVLIAAVFAAFAVDNRAPVTFSLFPLPYTAEMPLFMLVLLCFMLGAGVAGVIAWLASLQRRLELGTTKRHITALENEVGGLRAERNILPPA